MQQNDGQQLGSADSASAVTLKKLTSLTEQHNLLNLELARTQTKLAYSESRLTTVSRADSSQKKKNKSAACDNHVGMSYSELAESLERAETELQRLRLRVEGRPVPYYKVVNEFFSDKLGNFVEPDHTCTCNICCLDLDGIKKKAFEDGKAQAAAEEASRRAQAGVEGASGSAITPEEVKG